ncbi:MAG: efflux RND transporter permease subunit [Chloroherpetonaceae bacterium]|nr:efflux RND transporter permease subunit [Chloroherpetonaceae bacterium]
MNIIEFSVKRYQFTIIVFLALMAIGINSFINISRSEDPQITFAGSVITAIYPGASPSDIEEIVVDPIEEKISTLDNIKSIKTDIEDGLAIIRVEFNSGEDPEEKYDEILRELNVIRPSLPQDLYSLEVRKISPTDVSIIQFALVSEDASYKLLESFGKDLKKSLGNIGGVKESEIHAVPKQEVRISIDISKLVAIKLSLNQVIQSIQSENANIPAGSIDIGKKKFNVKTSGNYRSKSEVEQTVVGAYGGNIVRLKDIAAIELIPEEQNYFARFNEKRAIFVTASLKSGQNIFTVRESIEEVVTSFRKELPSQIELEQGFDQAKNVAHRLGGLNRDFVIAILLVLITLLPLGIRASLVVMVSIPLSLLMGVFMLDLFGYNINQLSIVGFVIALGLLVDDSIVVVENTSRFLRMGYKPISAAIEATKQINVAVIGATATLIFAFLPLVFLPGNPGQYIRSMPVAVVVTVFASLIVSLTIVPFLSSRILIDEGEHGNRFLQLLTRFIEWSYARILQWALKHPKQTLLLALGVFLLSLTTIPIIGFSLFPKAGIPQFLITIEAPDGTNLVETNRAAEYVEKVLRESGEVAWMNTNIGKGNPRIYYNVFPREEKNNVAEIFAEVKHYHEVKTVRFFDSLRVQFNAYSGVKIELKEFENGPPIDAPIAIRVKGENLDTLKKMAEQVEQIIASVEGTIYINNPVQVSKTDLKIDIDHQKAGLLGVPIAELEKNVRMAIAGLSLGKVRESNGDEMDLRLTLPRERKPTLEVLDHLHVASVNGAMIPLRQVASISFVSSPTKINHFNEDRVVTITSYVKTGFNTDRITKEILKELNAYRFPEGYTFTAAGEIESREESFGGFGSIILIATFGIFAVLVLEFGSFRSTLIVFSVVPLGVVGGMLGLLLTGYTLSFTAVIGFIALMGIEIKTSILLVDFTNQLRAEGTELMEAIQKAGEIRFVPVLLTSATAIGGLIPIAIEGSGLYSPLAIVIIGGLISSTLLARLVTPVMYQLLPPEIEKR